MTATPAHPTAINRLPVIAYFDGLCPICVAEMRGYERAGGGLIQLHDCNGELPGDVDRDAALAALHVRLPDGRLATGWSAFIAIWDRLPRMRWLATLTRPAFIRIPLDAVYRLVVPFRPRRKCQDDVCAR